MGEDSWTYIKTVVDIVREPILFLDKNLCVMAANEPFYQMFQVEPRDTEGEVVYELGNGQWDIPTLRKLLEDILPQHTFFKGFEVAHKFPTIGRKVMILLLTKCGDNRAHREHHDKTTPEFKQPQLKRFPHPDNLDRGGRREEAEPHQEAAEEPRHNGGPTEQR